MTALEETIISAVKLELEKIKSGVTCVLDRSYTVGTRNYAKSINMAPEDFVRNEIAEQMTICYAYTNLVHMESSGLSPESVEVLLDLETQINRSAEGLSNASYHDR